jgi:hypothetical protein
MIPNIEINKEGNILTLYNDEVDLYDLGLVTNVRRASHIVFNEIKQWWEVVDMKTGEVVHKNKNRELAINKEIELFSPGGEYYFAQS